jgi:hypothetical protein
MSSWREEGIARARDDADREASRARRTMSREEKLVEVDAMIESGELIVRTATDEAERLRFGIRPAVEEVAVLEAETSPAAIRSPSQRAAAFIQRVDWGSEPVLTAAELAEEAGVAKRTMERALRVREADPELFAKLAEGRISATKADKAVSAR